MKFDLLELGRYGYVGLEYLNGCSTWGELEGEYLCLTASVITSLGMLFSWHQRLLSLCL